MNLHLTQAKWRTGRKVGRTLYAMVADEATDYDILIGVMDTEELAADVVTAHNASRVVP